MANYSIKAKGSDHGVYTNNSAFDYSGARSGSVGLNDNTGGNMRVGQLYSATGGTFYTCFETFLEFDTSAIDDGPASAVALVLNLSANPSSPVIEVAERTFSTGTGAWVAGASLPAGVGSATISGTGSKSITLSLTTIPISSSYGLMVYGQKQRTNNAPTADETITYVGSAGLGGSTDPRLDFTITPIVVVDLDISNLSSGAPDLDGLQLGQKHALTANGFSAGAPVLDVADIGQKHVLAISAVSTGAPDVGEPSVGSFQDIDLTGITAGQPTLGSPVLSIADPLTLVGITLGSPALDAPVVGVIHVLAIGDVATGAPTLGTPVVGSLNSFVIAGIVAGAPELGRPIIGQIVPPFEWHPVEPVAGFWTPVQAVDVDWTP